MKIKAVMLMTAIALPLALPVASHPSGDKPIDRIIETLALDDARAAQVREILKSHHEERMALHKEMRQAMKAMHQEHQQDLAQILSQEELDKLKEMRKKRHRRHFGKHPKGE